jgi:hypothetical protein
MDKKYIFTVNCHDRHSYDFHGYINKEENKFSNSSFLVEDYKGRAVEHNVMNQFGSGDAMSYDLLILDEDVNEDLFLLKFYDGLDEYEEHAKPGYIVNVDKDCSADNIKKIMDIVSENPKLGLPVKLIQLDTSFYMPIEEVKKELLEAGIPTENLKDFLN